MASRNAHRTAAAAPVATSLESPVAARRGRRRTRAPAATKSTSAVRSALTRIGPFAPTALAVAGRYARRNPFRAALMASLLGGLLYVGRRWWMPDSMPSAATVAH